MELKRKRWRLKSYEQCFSGAEALEWLHNYIQNHPSFGAHVTREQTFLLLQKFLENKVFENATSKSSKKFQDTNCLYRFAEEVNEYFSKNKLENKENMTLHNSLRNLLKNFKRNSRTNPVDTAEEIQKKNNHITVKENLKQAEPVPCMTPLALDLENVKVGSSKNNSYCDMSTILCDDDSTFDTSISEQYFARSNSLRVNKGFHKKNKITESFLETQCEEDLLYADSINPDRKQSSLKLYKRTVPVVRLKTTNDKKKREVPKRNTVTLGKRQSTDSNREEFSPRKKIRSDSNLLKQAPRSSLLPRKAVTILGEKPSYIKEVDSYNTYEVRKLPGFRPNNKSENAFEKPKQFIMEKSHDQNISSKINSKKNIEPKNFQRNGNHATFPNHRKYQQHSMKRRSLSQNNLSFYQKYESVENILETKDFQRSTSTANLKKQSLYKAPSTWSINTIGLSTDIREEYPNESHDLTTTDIEDSWKSTALLRFMLFPFSASGCTKYRKVKKAVKKNFFTRIFVLR